MLLTTVSHSGAVCVLCAGSVRVCACTEEVGGRQPVQFKGKIQGTHKAGSAGRQAGGQAGRQAGRQQERQGKEKVVGIC